MHQISSGEILSNFCSLIFCLLLNKFKKNAFESSGLFRFVRII